MHVYMYVYYQSIFKELESSALTAFCNFCKSLSGGGYVQCWRYNFEYSKLKV